MTAKLPQSDKQDIAHHPVANMPTASPPLSTNFNYLLRYEIDATIGGDKDFYVHL